MTFGARLAELTHLKKLSTNSRALLGLCVKPLEAIDGSENEAQGIQRDPLPAILAVSLVELEIVACNARATPHLQDLALARQLGKCSISNPSLLYFAKRLVDEDAATHERLADLGV